MLRSGCKSIFESSILARNQGSFLLVDHDGLTPLCGVAEASKAFSKLMIYNRYKMITFLINRAFLGSDAAEEEGSEDPFSEVSRQWCYHLVHAEFAAAIT